MDRPHLSYPKAAETGRRTATTTAASATVSASMLLRLPHWLLLRVARLLPARDLLNLEGCCQQLKEAGNAWDGLWRHRMISDFVRRYESLPAALDLTGGALCSCRITGGGCCTAANDRPYEESASLSSAPADADVPASDSPSSIRARGSEGLRWPYEAGGPSVRRSTAYTLGIYPFTWRVLYFRVCMLLRNFRGGLAHRRVVKQALKQPIDATIEGGLCVTLDCRRLLWCNGEILQCIDMDLGCILWSTPLAAVTPQPAAAAAVAARRQVMLGLPMERGATAAAGILTEYLSMGPPGVSMDGPLGGVQGWRSRCHVVASASHAFTFVGGRLHVFCMHSGLLVKEIDLGLAPQQAAAAGSPMPIDICQRNSQFVFISRLGASFFHSETLEPLFGLQHMETVQLMLLRQQQQQQRSAYWGGERPGGGPPPHTDDVFDFCWAGAACTGRPLHRLWNPLQKPQQPEQQGGASTEERIPNSRRGPCGCFCHLHGAERSNRACEARGCWDGWRSSSDNNNGGYFASRRCSDTEMQCSMRCCRLRCRHVVTWHSGVSRRLLVWSSGSVLGDAAPADTRLAYILKGHESPVMRVRQQTDWRDMHEYFLASLDVMGTVRVWHSAAFPPSETAAAAAAEAAARAAETDPAVAAAWAWEQQQQGLEALASEEATDGHSNRRAFSKAETNEDEGMRGIGCIAIIPAMGAYWIHRISLSSHGLLTLCRPRELPQRNHQQQQQLLLLWAMKVPSLSSMRAHRRGTSREPPLPLDWGETDPDLMWKHMLNTWRHLGRETADEEFSLKIDFILKKRQASAAAAAAGEVAVDEGESLGDAAQSLDRERSPVCDQRTAATARAAAAGAFDTANKPTAAPSIALSDAAAALEAAASVAPATRPAAVAAACRESCSGSPPGSPICKSITSRGNGGVLLLPLQQQHRQRADRGSIPIGNIRNMELLTTDIHGYNRISFEEDDGHPLGTSRSRTSSARMEEDCFVCGSLRVCGDNSSNICSSSRNTNNNSSNISIGTTLNNTYSRTPVAENSSSTNNNTVNSNNNSVGSLQVSGAYTLPGNVFFAEFNAKGLISVLCGDDEGGGMGAFPPRIPRSNPFKRCLSDWLVFDLERLETEGQGDTPEDAADDANEAATAAIAVELYDEGVLAERRVRRCCWRDTQPPGIDHTNLPFQAFFEPAATQRRLQQQQRGEEEQKKKDAVKRHRRVVLQWVEKQRRRRYRAAAAAAAAVVADGKGATAKTFVPVALALPVGSHAPPAGHRSFFNSNGGTRNSNTCSSSSNRNSSHPAQQGSNAFSRGGDGVYPGVYQELRPLSSVAWLREKGNAWALIDWKAVQIDAKGTLVIHDFAHPDASPICPLAFL